MVGVPLTPRRPYSDTRTRDQLCETQSNGIDPDRHDMMKAGSISDNS
jgi:hypothetical protein